MKQFLLGIFSILIIIMLYPAISAIISGSLSYAYGIGALDQAFKKEKVKPEQVKQVKQVQYLAKDDAKTLDPVPRVVTALDKVPIVPNVYKITLNEFCHITYSSLHKAPLAVHEYLNKDVITGDAQRDQKFHTDPAFGRDIPEYFGVNDDVYTKIGISKNFQFDRGHMAGASNYNSSQKLKSSTFSLANTVPQNQYNNRGIWNTFQRYSRDLLLQNKCDTIEIVSGPIYYSDIPQSKYKQVFRNEQLVFTENGMIAPPKLYKFIKCNTKSGSYASGFIFENKKGENFDNNRTLASFEADTVEIEKKTGLVFNCMKNPDSTTLNKLTDFDKETLNKTKLQRDIPFYNSLFENEKTLSGMNSCKLRAYSDNGITIDTKSYQDKIKEAAIQDLNQLKKEPNLNCSKLNQTLSYSKDLYYLDRQFYEKSYEQLCALIDAKIQPCLKEEDKRMRGYISKKAFSQGSFKYPLQEKLRDKFPPQAPKSAL